MGTGWLWVDNGCGIYVNLIFMVTGLASVFILFLYLGCCWWIQPRIEFVSKRRQEVEIWHFLKIGKCWIGTHFFFCKFLRRSSVDFEHLLYLVMVLFWWNWDFIISNAWWGCSLELRHWFRLIVFIWNFNSRRCPSRRRASLIDELWVVVVVFDNPSFELVCSLFLSLVSLMLSIGFVLWFHYYNWLKLLQILSNKWGFGVWGHCDHPA